MHFYCLLPEHTVLYTSPVVIRNEKLLLAFVSGMLPFVELKEEKKLLLLNVPWQVRIL